MSGGSWRPFAACLEVGPHLFDSREEGVPSRGDIAEAKRICGTCDVRQQCLDDAIEEERGQHRVMRQGVRGGMTPSERIRYESGDPEPVRTPRPPPRIRPTHAPNCLDCGVGLRTRSQPDDGRRIHYGHGRCGRCYDRLKAKEQGRELRTSQKRPEECAECGEQTRPQARRDLPGAPYAGRGMCVRCYRSERRKGDAA